MIQPSENLVHNDDTMMKVLRALTSSGMSFGGAVAAINRMFDAGILFRERRPSSPSTEPVCRGGG